MDRARPASRRTGGRRMGRVRCGPLKAAPVWRVVIRIKAPMPSRFSAHRSSIVGDIKAGPAAAPAMTAPPRASPKRAGRVSIDVRSLWKSTDGRRRDRPCKRMRWSMQ